MAVMWVDTASLPAFFAPARVRPVPATPRSNSLTHQEPTTPGNRESPPARLSPMIRPWRLAMYAEHLRQAASDLEKAAKDGDGAQAASLGAGLLDVLQKTAEDLNQFLVP